MLLSHSTQLASLSSSVRALLSHRRFALENPPPPLQSRSTDSSTSAPVSDFHRCSLQFGHMNHSNNHRKSAELVLQNQFCKVLQNSTLQNQFCNRMDSAVQNQFCRTCRMVLYMGVKGAPS
ncbi:uncharacterized protein G2W53_022016 [Senna tora]|uniref:Uncharacterized protein n=1 Tax=Senna tora TaxID=362788 RepID=A0A834TKL1_9FABA|nr:uncharacterized protein G2W53_022016 [Senna tora]